LYKIVVHFYHLQKEIIIFFVGLFLLIIAAHVVAYSGRSLGPSVTTRNYMKLNMPGTVQDTGLVLMGHLQDTESVGLMVT